MASRWLSRYCLPFSLAAALASSLAAAEPPVRARGEEFQANIETLGDQHEPAVASQPDGRSMVVWADRWRGLYGRAFDASGLPVSPPVVIDEDPHWFYPHRVRIAADGEGGYLVVWAKLGTGGQTDRILAHRYDVNGDPLGTVRTLYIAGLQEYLATVDVVSRGPEGFLVAWSYANGSGSGILLQAVDRLGEPQSGAFLASQAAGGSRQYPRLAVQGSGEALVTWIDERETGNPDVWARRVTVSGLLRGPERRIETDNGGEAAGAVPVAHDDGGFSVVWTNSSFGKTSVYAQRLNTAGQRTGPPVLLSEAARYFAAPAAATDPDGNLLVLWAGYELDVDGGVMGRFFSPSWQPLGEIFRVNTFTLFDQTDPVVAADGRGGFTAVWSSGEEPFIITPPPPDFRGQDGSSYGVFGQRLETPGAPPCARGSRVLCLGEDGRFEVRVTWTLPTSGESGTGKAVPLTSDTGALWFFGEANLELMIKVLDARLVNGHFWVYYGALSDVEYTITVTDTATGREKTYHNPQRWLASRADVLAFPGASSLLEIATAPVVVPRTPPLPAAAAGAATCQPSSAGLCLNEGRFLVEVQAIDPRTNEKVQARAVPLTGDTGAFWFFGENNLELMIKVLDGRAHNGRFWVYYGALSDVPYTITVTDMETREKRTYENAPGKLISRADVDAF